MRDPDADTSALHGVLEDSYRSLFQCSPHAQCVYEPESLRFLAVNDSAIRTFGFSQHEFLTMRISDLGDLMDCEPEPTPQTRGTAERYQVEGRRTRILRKDGHFIDAEISSKAIDFEGSAARLVIVVDVSAQVQAEREVSRLARAQKMLTACNEALIKATDRGNFLDRICRIAVDIGGYLVSWVAFAHHDENKSVEMVALAGELSDQLRDLPLSWSEDLPAGRGTVGRAIRSGEIVVIRDIYDEPDIQLLADAVRGSKARGLITLPIREHDKVCAVLSLCAPQALHLSEQELGLLRELANALTFGIAYLDAKVNQQRLQESLLSVAAAVSSELGEAFFERFVASFVKAVGANAGCIVELLGETPSSVRTIATVDDGRPGCSFETSLQNGPFEEVLLEDVWCVTEGLNAKFPQLSKVQRFESFVGCRLKNATGTPIGALGAFFDVPLHETAVVESTLRIFAARAAAELERRQKDVFIREQASLLDKAQDAIVVQDLQGCIQFWNRSAERLYGFTAQEALGASAVALLHRGDTSRTEAAAQHLLLHEEWTGEITQSRKDGSLITVEARWNLVKDAAGKPKAILSINTDITARKEAERAIHRAEYYDSLTDLPNRQLFVALLLEALGRARTSGQQGALLILDIDNFRLVNKTLGHKHGDALLQLVAQKLRKNLPTASAAARIGGDEFVILLEDLGTEPHMAKRRALGKAEELLQCLAVPFLVGEFEQHVSTCAGITTFSASDRDHMDDLFTQVDLALFNAKSGGKNTIRFFEPEYQQAAAEKAVLEGDLAQALARNELSLHYQPQIDRHGTLIGVEALLRWKHPRLGQISPATFIPLAEETGLILSIGQWVVESACNTLARWRTIPRMAGISMSVNVSAAQLRAENFVERVGHATRIPGVKAELLKLELTESILVDDIEGIIAKMNAIRALGVGFSLDDFGTGYSSLSYLKRMPLDQLKIDQSFVQDILKDANDAAIAKTIIALGNSLGLSVVAEGVETAAQRDFLFAHGCDAYQGYLLSRPIPLADLERLALELP